MGNQLSVACAEPLERIPACSQCGERDAQNGTLTADLMNDVMDKSSVTNGTDAPITLRLWLQGRAGRKAKLIDNETKTVIVTAESNDESTIVITNVNCEFLFDQLSAKSCGEFGLLKNQYFFDTCIEDPADPFQGEPARTASCFAVVQFAQFAAIYPPSITVPPLIAPEKYLCEPPADTSLDLQGQTSYQIDLDDSGCPVTITFQCTAPLSVFARAFTGTCLDCDGNTVDCAIDAAQVACKRYERVWSIVDPCCSGEGPRLCTEAVQLIDVVMGGPCFTCPANVCEPALETTGDPQEVLRAQKAIDQASIENAGVRNGCGVLLTPEQYTIDCDDEIICSRCCRGEVSVERTWTVTDLVCDKSARCVQRLRVVNPCWERYFPTTRQQQCPCAQD